MYICNNCKQMFEEPDFLYETHGLDTPPYEKLYFCPYCHCGDFNFIYQTDI